MIFLFVTSFCAVHSENLSTYKIIDLGLFETDSSYAFSINEKGQILGTFRENNLSYAFLWDEINGLKIMEPPEDYIFSSMRLNNEGQIAGMMYLPSSATWTIFYWDIHLGFWEIESGNCSIIGFNDKGQILGRLNNQIIIWDHGKKTDLKSLFLNEVPGDWGMIHTPHLNNLGHVAFSVFDYTLGKCKFFIWDGNFIPISLNKEIGELVDEDDCIRFLDDNDNLILDLHLSRTKKRYFISPYSDFFIPCSECESIKNGIPLSLDCLPSKLKKDRQGNFYFQKGITIKNLLKEKSPYYHITDNTKILDQNSKGYVVGYVDTLYGQHAFLAIPEFEKD